MESVFTCRLNRVMAWGGAVLQARSGQESISAGFCCLKNVVIQLFFVDTLIFHTSIKGEVALSRHLCRNSLNTFFTTL